MRIRFFNKLYRMFLYHILNSRLKYFVLFAEKISSAFSRIFSLIDFIGGFIQNTITIREEKWRVGVHNLKLKFEAVRTIIKIWSLSKNVLLYLLLATLVFALLDYFIVPFVRDFTLVYDYFDNSNYSHIFSFLPSPEFSKLLLQVFLSAIAALLGLIFALFIFGFQAATGKFSGSVIKYINREPVSILFYQLLIFTIVFNLLTLILSEVFHKPPVFSLLFCFLLALTSFLAILLLKDHYFYSIQPEYVFNRLTSDISKDVDIACKIGMSFPKSWSVVISKRDMVTKNFEIMDLLINDLLEQERYEDISYGIAAYAAVLVHYFNKKHFFDKQNINWFQLKKELHSEHDYSAYDLKLSYEQMGFGPRFTERNHDIFWIEDIVRDKFSELSKVSNNSVLRSLISSISTILFGKYTKDKYGKEITIASGALCLHEFDTLLKYLQLFSTVTDKVNESQDENTFMLWDNEMFRMFFYIIDGVKTTDCNVLSKMIYENTIHEILKSGNSTFEKDLCKQYHTMISLEKYAENNETVTPTWWIEKQISKQIEEKGKEIYNSASKILVDAMDKVVLASDKNKNIERLACIWLTELILLRRHMFLNKSDLISEHIKIFRNHVSIFTQIPSSFIEEKEIIFNSELNAFMSVFNNLDNISTLSIDSYIISTSYGITNSSEEMQLLRIRGLLYLGGYIFLCSEFYGNTTILNFYTERLRFFHKRLSNKDFINMWETILEDRRNTLISAEIYRYSNHFTKILSIMDRDLKRIPRINPDTEKETLFKSLYQTFVFEHSSPFIQELAERTYRDEEDFLKAFLNHLKDIYGDDNEME